ncbi:MAG: hypothetical protein HY077_14120 [Elusimicrobia bacterium]|nr:hypothetical protein [Elusimicrobiota bacterium]
MRRLIFSVALTVFALASWAAAADTNAVMSYQQSLISIVNNGGAQDAQQTCKDKVSDADPLKLMRCCVTRLIVADVLGGKLVPGFPPYFDFNYTNPGVERQKVIPPFRAYLASQKP